MVEKGQPNIVQQNLPASSGVTGLSKQDQLNIQRRMMWPAEEKAYILEKYSEDYSAAFRLETNFKLPETLLPKQVLVEMRYGSINPVDTMIANGSFRIIRLDLPSVLGQDGTGKIVGVGNQVSKFKIGEEVFGISSFGAGLTSAAKKFGTWGRFALFEESDLAIKPANLDWKIAGGFPLVALTAYQAFLLLKPDPKNFVTGKDILIHGASGGVGSFAVLLAKHMFKARRVFATCSSEGAEWVQQLGADRVIDYKSEDFVQVIQSELKNQPLSFVFDTVGGEKIATDSYKLLNGDGAFITIAPPSHSLTLGEGVKWFFKEVAWNTILGSLPFTNQPKFYTFLTQSDGSQLEEIADWFIKNKFHEKNLFRVGKEFMWDQILEALHDFEKTHTIGKYLIKQDF